MKLLHETTEAGEDLLGRPWSRPLSGTLDRLVVESDLLADNPLGDPARRPLYVLRPPGVELDHPRRVARLGPGQVDRAGPGYARATRQACLINLPAALKLPDSHGNEHDCACGMIL